MKNSVEQTFRSKKCSDKRAETAAEAKQVFTDPDVLHAVLTTYPIVRMLTFRVSRAFFNKLRDSYCANCERMFLQVQLSVK